MQMEDVTWCPRCEYPAEVETEADGGGGARLAYCARCANAFCAECRLAWHGVAPCANLASRWRDADERGREALKRQYGPRLLEEVESAEWIRSHARACPKCHGPTEKQGGCNHITCATCRHEWCWLCRATYTKGHFRLGLCEQFSQDFFDEINLSREEFEHQYVVLDHW